ncbi:uncharacterized protein IWZ02DRAFT_437650 [Phyllosticta citriasiana]|uniref:uncharacterized protein n=1 Tax=Phyllosticta citriasiana TaxID=595635 RepID=UPI0030FD430C
MDKKGEKYLVADEESSSLNAYWYHIANSSSLLFLFSLHRIPTYLPSYLLPSLHHRCGGAPAKSPPLPTDTASSLQIQRQQPNESLARRTFFASNDLFGPRPPKSQTQPPSSGPAKPIRRASLIDIRTPLRRATTTATFYPCSLASAAAAAAAAAAVIHHQHSHVVDGVGDERGSEETRKEEKTREEEQEQGKCRRARERRERKAVKRRGIAISDGDDNEDELGYDADDKTS